MSAVANSAVSLRNNRSRLIPGSSSMQVDKCLSSHKVFFSPNSQSKRNTLKYRSQLIVRASEDDGRTSGADIFVGGFLLGGLVVGTLGCIYAPQLSKALAAVDKKDLMRKLPKFMYDEEKALEKTRIILTDKIAQLNTAIDKVSSQLRGEDDTVDDDDEEDEDEDEDEDEEQEVILNREFLV